MEGRSLDQVRETAVQLRRAMLRIDPVQHHGPYCLMPSDGEAHLPSLLPVETLRQAVVLGGRSAHLRLRPLPDQVFSIDALLEACDAFERMAAKRRVAGDRYSAKMLGSILLLVPSLLAAAMGRPMEKGESFAWLKREATPDLRNAVVTIERWRAEWKHALAPPLPQGMVTQRVLRTINRLPSVELMRRSGVLHEAGRCLFRGAWAMLAELERATR